MANIKSAQKRARQTTRRTTRNKSVLTAMRSAIKAARSAKLTSKTSKNGQIVDVIKEAVSKIMKAASKGIIHNKTAARYVSRLTRSRSSN